MSVLARILAAIVVADSALGMPDATQCKGGPVASCRCLLSCEVFGAKPEKCDAGEDGVQPDVNAVVHDVVSSSLKKDLVENPDCAGIKCIVGCAKQLECLDQRVQGECENVKDGQKDCKVDCSGASRSVLKLLPMAIPLALVSLFSPVV